jgi:iron complex outermembrane receptor protein
MVNNYQCKGVNKPLADRCRKAFLQMLFMLLGTLCLSAMSMQSVSAQSNSVLVKGTVTDETGAVLPGVNIMEKGTTNGTVTDAEGKYNITVANNQSILVFSFVGTATQSVVVGDRTDIGVQLLFDAASLSEVVVVGYGTQEKKDVTGALTAVRSEDFNKGIINSPEQLLQGKVAGLNVTSASGAPGGAQSISIRGIGGVRSGSTPLFVLDGFALDNSSTGGTINPLSFLNPQDIESIDVLKDASATAIYGTRGANGVILITTKKGKANTSSITYSASVGISKLARPIDVFTADEYREAITSIGGTLVDSLANTDWQKEITRTAITQNHNLSMSGGTDKLTYFASFGLQNQEGILEHSSLKRYSGRFNATQRLLDDRLTINVNLASAYTSNELPPSENNGTSITILGAALSMNPTFAAYDRNGNVYNYPNVTSPLVSLGLGTDVTNTTRTIGNISPSFEIVKGLVYKLNFGIDHSTSVRDQQSFGSAVPKQDGRLTSSYGTNNNSLIENYLTYKFDLGEHSFGVLAGHSYQKFFVQTRSWSINKFPVGGSEPQYNPGQGQDLTLANNRPTGSSIRNDLQSFFGRVNYDFKDRYYVTGTVRVDGSSKFGKNNKYGTFPSFSLGWRLSEEDFVKSASFVDDLKIRAGWGQVGNQEIPAKITQQLVISDLSAGSTYPLTPTGAYPAGTTYQRTANPDIQWEVSTQTNVGVDFAFLGGALSGSIDAFQKESSNILLLVPAIDPKPFPTFWKNVEGMKIMNKGLELALNYQFKPAGDFTFNVGGNVTLLKNEVSGSPYSVIQSGTATGSGLSNATINGYVNGEPVGTFFLRQFTGFNEKGQSTYWDKNGDGYVSDLDRVAAGTAFPTTLYSFFLAAKYKSFDLTANFNGVSGNKIYDNTANTNFYKNKIFKGVNTTAEGTQYPEENTSNSAPVSTRYIKDGAFLRLNNLTVGYNLNPNAVGLGNWVKSLRLSVTGQNLFVITKYDGYDPEVNTDRTTADGVNSFGIDYLSYPKARTFTIGLNASF